MASRPENLLNLFIIAMAKVFTWLVAMQQTTQLVHKTASTLWPCPPGVCFCLSWRAFWFLGCVMETTAALILLVPVLAVLSPQMGVDPVRFGVLMVVNLAVMPYVAVALVALVISCFWPPLTLWLPSLIYR